MSTRVRRGETMALLGRSAVLAIGAGFTKPGETDFGVSNRGADAVGPILPPPLQATAATKITSEPNAKRRCFIAKNLPRRSRPEFLQSVLSTERATER